MIFSDPYPQCVLPKDDVLLHNQHGAGTKKESQFYRVIRYKCDSADRIIKQATCVSGRWMPEIDCTSMIFDFYTISSFYGGMTNAHY